MISAPCSPIIKILIARVCARTCSHSSRKFYRARKNAALISPSILMTRRVICSACRALSARRMIWIFFLKPSQAQPTALHYVLALIAAALIMICQPWPNSSDRAFISLTFAALAETQMSSAHFSKPAISIAILI